MAHKFKLHQRVRLSQQVSSGMRVAAGDVWEVVRLLPADETGELHYRLRSSGQERAASEQDLRAA